MHAASHTFQYPKVTPVSPQAASTTQPPQQPAPKQPKR
jgi:hypothetical protein